MEKKCLICSKVFTKLVKHSKIEWEKKKFCSYKCYWKSKLGSIPWNKGLKVPAISKALTGRKYSPKTLKKMSDSHKGKKQSAETVAKRVLNNRREKHYEWKGDDVGYGALHVWVKKELGQPDSCEHCPKSGLKGMKIHWANKSGKYLRRHDDWLRLCVSCHRKYDFAKIKITWKK